jgi:hypothetical protein
MEQKYRLEFEFRYNGIKYGEIYNNKSKTIIIGIFDALDDAIDAGNKMLSILKDFFEIRNTDFFTNRRFSPRLLVSNCGYNDKITYFGQIITMEIVDDITDTVKECLSEYKKAKLIKKRLENFE